MEEREGIEWKRGRKGKSGRVGGEELEWKRGKGRAGVEKREGKG